MLIEVKMHLISCNSGHIYMFLFCVMCRCLPSLAVRCVSGSTLLHTASIFFWCCSSYQGIIIIIIIVWIGMLNMFKGITFFSSFLKEILLCIQNLKKIMLNIKLCMWVLCMKIAIIAFFGTMILSFWDSQCWLS